MGSKGSQTTTQQQSQTQTPNPYVGGAGQAAIQGAEYAAGQPFQMPVAPLAPFTPFQEQGFQEVQNLQGMAQPYFGAGAGYLAGSAAPVTGEDVAGYYNPMAGSVMAGMQDVFGQQMREATGRLTQQAGGVGAGRIPVAQANLAKQQGLAAGQTLAGLYYPALQAAQQQKQMMAGAGYGFGQMGPAAQAAQLQGIQALMGAGGQQQALSQQYLQNLYANRLAQIGYPFQTAQYLAGITGGLAPAMGGTTQGTATTTAPAPSLASQLLGIGTAGVGLAGSMGAFGGGGGYSPSNAYQTSLGWYQSPAWYNTKRGGRIPTGMKGGGSPPPLPPPPAPVYSPAPIGRSGEMSAAIPPGGMSTEEAIAEAAPFFKYYGGSGDIPSWATSQIGRMTTPAARTMLNPFVAPSGRSHWIDDLIPPLGKQIFANFPSAAFDERQGPSYPGEGQYIYADGGGVDEQPDITSVVPDIPVQSSGSAFPKLTFSSPSTGGGGGGGGGKGSDIGKVASAAAQILPMLMLKRGGSVGGAVNPFDVGRPFQEGGQADDSEEIDASDITLEHQGLGQTPDWSPVQQSAPQMIAAGATPQAFDEGDVSGGTTELSAAPRSQYPASPFGGSYANRDMTMQGQMMPRGQMPYPDATQRDWGQRFTRSPWMALVQAGAKMAQTPGPIGSVIGAGLGAAGKTLDEQRKELRSEEQINQKAQALFETAQRHLDRYQRKTPHELATEQYHEQVLARTKYAPVNIERINEKGEPETVAARFNPSTGQYEDTQTGKPVTGKLVARQTGAESATSRAARAQSAAEKDPAYWTDQLGTINKWRAANSLPPWTIGDLGSSRETATLDPGEGKRIPGKWYIVNGVPKRWAE